MTNLIWLHYDDFLQLNRKIERKKSEKSGKKSEKMRKGLFFNGFCLFLTVFAGGCERDSQDVKKEAAYLHPSQKSLPKEVFTIGGETFEIELAFTQKTRAQGLMFRESIGKNEGMFFVFQRPSIQQFYMKNCRVDLDILFIKEDGHIDKVAHMTVPLPGQKLKHYRSQTQVRFVLELASGTCNRLNLQPGQILELPKRIYRILPDKN